MLVLIDSFDALNSENQKKILRFFINLKSSSKLLLSSRISLKDFLDQIDLSGHSHHIQVKGLSPKHARKLINAYSARNQIPVRLRPAQEQDRLAKIAGNNPWAIIKVLGAVATQSIPLKQVVDEISTNTPQSETEEVAGKIDEIFDQISRVWERFFTENDKLVLMAKAFSSRPTPAKALGIIAGVEKTDLQRACETLQASSFFEKERSAHGRITTHPLVQAYAQRMLTERVEARAQMEIRWWRDYAPGVLRLASSSSYESIQPELKDSVDDIAQHIEKHLNSGESQHLDQALNLFLVGDGSSSIEHHAVIKTYGIGHILRHWGKWDALIRIATRCLDHIRDNPRLIRECGLRLLARACCDRREVDQASEFIDFAQGQNLKLKDKRLEASILFSEAEVERQKGNFSLAIAKLKRALDILNDFGGQLVCDVAPTYMVLGGCTTEHAARDLKEGLLKDNVAAIDGLSEAEEYLNKSEQLFMSQGMEYPEQKFDIVSIQAYKAVIARLRGNFELARELFTSCEGEFLSISSVTRLYLERALLEHLAGDVSEARRRENKALILMRQVGIELDKGPKYNCYQVIETMKSCGTW